MPLALSSDDSKLFTLKDDMIFGIETSGFSMVLNTSLGFYGSKVACGRPTRLYVVAYAPAAEKGKIKIVDSNTGAIVGDIAIPDVQLQSMVISSDGNTLFGVGQPMDHGFLVGMLNVYRIDISTDVATVSTTRAASNQVALQLSPNGKKLFVEQHYFPSTNTILDVWNSTTLQSIGQLNVSNVSGYLPTNDTVYGFNFNRDENCPSGFYYKIQLMDMVPGSLPKFWNYFSGWSGDTSVMLFFSKNQKSIYLFDLHRNAWVIELGHQ